MSKPAFSMGFKPQKLAVSSSKKPVARPAAASRVAFGEPDSDDDQAPPPPAFAGTNSSSRSKPKPSPSLPPGSAAPRPPSPKAVEAITEFGIDTPSDARPPSPPSPRRKKKNKHAPPPPAEPPSLKPKSASSAAERRPDLATALTSRRHLADAVAADPTIFDYDAVYDTLKAKPPAAGDDDDDNEAEATAKKSRYVSSLLSASVVRTRDRQIAEEKKIARERAAEGDEFAGKERFVTSAYKKLQEENARIAEEERRREEEEDGGRGKTGKRAAGMTGFYKKLLDEGEERHRMVLRAVEAEEKRRTAKEGDGQGGTNGDADEKGGNMADEEAPPADETPPADLAREINSLGGAVQVNEDGEVVDKRELLRGGLNVTARKKREVERPGAGDRSSARAGGGPVGGRGVGGRAGMRDRQTRMMEEQLAQQLKRSCEQEDEERERVERAAKSRKTESDVSSAKERYLARKRAAAEEAKNKTTDS